MNSLKLHKDKNIKSILQILKKNYSHAKIALIFKSNFELLVATVLSAQCTDVMVNKVTAKLFKKYRSIADYANADIKVFEQDIRSTGFFRNKAKNIIALSNILLNQYNGKIPKTMEELTALPGVARKTANIVLGNAFGISSGIAVDTHVKRLSQRLGLSENTDPKKIEQDLMRIIPQKYWIIISHYLIQHGRKVCIARKPHCSICPLLGQCSYKDKIL